MIEKKILILCKSPIQGLGDTKSTAEKEHAINFYGQQKDLKYIKSKQKILK